MPGGGLARSIIKQNKRFWAPSKEKRKRHDPQHVMWKLGIPHPAPNLICKKKSQDKDTLIQTLDSWYFLLDFCMFVLTDFVISTEVCFSILRATN